SISSSERCSVSFHHLVILSGYLRPSASRQQKSAPYPHPIANNNKRPLKRRPNLLVSKYAPRGFEPLTLGFVVPAELKPINNFNSIGWTKPAGSLRPLCFLFA